MPRNYTISDAVREQRCKAGRSKNGKSEAGEIGGKRSTFAKRRAAKENGKLGGRPKGSKNRPK